MHLSSVQGEFKRALREAVDEGLLALGEGVRQVIYYHIERSRQVEPEQIPDKIESFHEALRGMFGSGAILLERIIARDLYNRLGLNFTEYENWTLVNYGNHAKKISELRVG